MEAGPSSGAAAERQARVEDEAPSEAAAPTASIVGREAEAVAAADNASSPRSESRPRLRRVHVDYGRDPRSEWGTYDIDLDGDESRSPDEPLPQEWTQPRTILEDGTATELIVAQSIEHRMSKSGLERIVLLSPSRPPPSSGSTGQEREKFRWLHVQPNSNTPEVDDVEPAFKALERFVLNCPFISTRIRTAALLFLKGSARKNVKTARATKALWTLQHPFLSLETGPVLFLGTMGVGRLHAQTLLRASRGYDVGDERELSQVARKMGVGGGHDVLHAAGLWCMSLGPGIMITLCCLPSTHLRGDFIEIDDRAGRGFYIVQVKLLDREFCHSIVIDPECSYVDFLQHAVAVATSGTRVRYAAMYDILYGSQTSGDAEKSEQLEVLSPSKWLQLLGSDGVENNTFHLKPTWEDRSRSRRPYHHKRHSPHFVQRRSSYQKSPRSLTLLLAPRRYGYSEVTGRGQSFPVPVNSDLETERYVVVPRRSTRRYYDDNSPVMSSDDDSPVMSSDDDSPVMSSDDNSSVTEMFRRSSDINTHSHRGRGRWHRRRERGYDSDSNNNPPVAEQETPPLNDSSAVTVAPFFAWRVKSMADMDAVGGDQNNNSTTNPRPDATIHNLFRILGNINESLLSGESGIKAIYSRAYKCTQENLLKRHPNLTREMAPGLNTSPTVQRDGVGQEADQEKKGRPADNGSTQPPDITSTPDSTRVGSASQEQGTPRQEKIGPSNTGDKQAPATSQADPQRSAGRSTSVMIAHPADAFGKQLLEISQAIMGRFLPKDEHSIYHVVCERFWGSVDEAIRQVRWSTERSGALWTIRDVDTIFGAAGGSGGVTAKKPYAGCTACSMATRYPSASAALQHLHTAHIECPLGELAAGKTKDPHDDPCYAYIKLLTDTHSNNEPAIENIAKEFISHLSDFSGSLNQIQWLVATISQDSPHRRRSGPNQPQPPAKPAIRPQLPRSLVYSFDELVSYYILQAKRLSLQNRGIGLIARNNAELVESQEALDRSEALAVRCRDIRARLQGYLQQARLDVIASRGAGSDDDADTLALGVQALDTTSFMRALTRSALDTTFSAPLPPKKTAGTGARVGPGRLQVGKHIIRVWDVVGMYSEYSKHLHVEAARRPRRRLFLDIHALEDELAALQALLDVNLDWIDWTLNNFPGGPEPDKVKVSYHSRRWKRRCREAQSYLLCRWNAVQAKLAEVENLQKSASALRERVRQLIEITDEDHGKAIRVFTFVTVLFLPMGFISGFFGMNTVDIRDIEATQSLYWTIAVPVTIVVLAIALAYGYKGDEISDWIRGRISLWKSNRIPRSAEVAAQVRPQQSSATDGRRVKWAGANVGAKEVWRTVRSSVRRRKRRQDMDRTRKSTFQTDILPS